MPEISPRYIGESEQSLSLIEGSLPKPDPCVNIIFKVHDGLDQFGWPAQQVNIKCDRLHGLFSVALLLIDEHPG